MDGDATQDWDWIGNLFDKRFPDFACLRCGYDKFLIHCNFPAVVAGKLTEALEGSDVETPLSGSRLQLFNDHLVRFFDQRSDDHFAYVICANCGHEERFFLPMLLAGRGPVTIFRHD